MRVLVLAGKRLQNEVLWKNGESIMLACRPPMGWNTWNTFGEEINEKLLMESADALVLLGYKDVGYEYIVIDDCWSEHKRDSSGRLVPDRKKFPNGMKALGDYIHSKGLKFGIYSCAGVETCAGYPGSYGYEFIDAATFAEWGVDFLKYDFCFFPEAGDCKQAYRTMSAALRACGREILFSACNWGEEDPAKWMRSIGAHMYRSTYDVHDNFKSISMRVSPQLDNMFASAPGCFNDFDMLVVGMHGKGNVGIGGCSGEEYKMQFGLWSFFGVPLMIGSDIRNISEADRALMQNRNLIALNQDGECRPPYEIRHQKYLYPNDVHVFARLLSDNRYAIAFLNLRDKEIKLPVFMHDMGFPTISGKALKITDAFTGEEEGIFRDCFYQNVPPHEIRLYIAEVVDAV